MNLCGLKINWQTFTRDYSTFFYIFFFEIQVFFRLTDMLFIEMNNSSSACVKMSNEAPLCGLDYTRSNLQNSIKPESWLRI